MTASEADAKDLVRAVTAELNAGNYDALEGFLADDYDDLHDNEAHETASELVREERQIGEAFPDKHEELDGILTDTDPRVGEHLNAWYTVTGTHEGEILNLPPTGHRVEYPFIRTFVVEDGAITRYRMIFTLGFLLDVGLDWEALTDSVDMQSYLTAPETGPD